MTCLQPRVVIVDGVPMSALVAEAPDPRAVIVAIHGGGTTSIYFDCPGHPESSLLRAGAAHGFTVVALDRPGYGSSAPYPEAVARPEQRVQLAYAAVDRILGERPRGAGVFLMGHSGGCELAMRMAAERTRWRSAGYRTGGHRPALPPGGPRNAQGGNPGTPPVRSASNCYGIQRNCIRPKCSAGQRFIPGAPPYEDLMVSNWARQDFPALAPAVRVPVHFSIAEHEKVWQTDTSAMAEIAAMFSGAPRFEVHHQPGAGHNISLGHTAADYHATVLSNSPRNACTHARRKS